MKSSLLLAVVASALLGGCVLPSPPALVTVQEQPAPVVYRSGYVVNELPSGYRTVHYNRNVYYENRGVYYRPHSRGYVVVTRPY